MGTEADKQNIGVIVTIVAVGTFAMIAVSLAVTALVRAEVKDLSEERSAAADLNTVRELKAGQRAGLNAAAHWSDRGKGLVGIPIERAMQLVAEDLRKNPHLATLSPPEKDEADGGAPTAEQAPSAPTEEGAEKQSPAGTEGAKKVPAAPAPGQSAPPVGATPPTAGGSSGVAPAPTPAPAPAGSNSPTP